MPTKPATAPDARARGGLLRGSAAQLLVARSPRCRCPSRQARDPPTGRSRQVGTSRPMRFSARDAGPCVKTYGSKALQRKLPIRALGVRVLHRGRPAGRIPANCSVKATAKGGDLTEHPPLHGLGRL